MVDNVDFETQQADKFCYVQGLIEFVSNAFCENN
jgi:hypothetical protein